MAISLRLATSSLRIGGRRPRSREKNRGRRRRAVLWGRGYDLQDMEYALREAVEAAATRPEVGPAVRAIYDAVAQEIDRRRPTCVVSGRCCHFEEYGHRLYVTTLELAAFRAQHTGQSTASWGGTGCPFQVGKLCGVHS